MNNRIFELAKEADLIEWDILPSGARTPDHESVVKARKFAELLIRECASIDFYKLAHIGTEDDYNVTQVIKEHFGVEE